jgi:EAL domain-containing protein (putative c-di-GMP-specific phosphodiesterase class I)
MDESVRQRGMIEDRLRQALATGAGLHMCYQPLVSGVSGEIVGLEALVRWQDAQLGSVPTEQFIPVAEETGLILPLGEWVLQQAARVGAQWPDLFMAVNLSPVQFRSPGVVERISSIILDAGATPSQMQLEVTERVLLDDSETLRTMLEILRSRGFRVVLDDFGTGYSSLSYLQKFRVDKIKIDQSFVRSIGVTEDASSIVMAVLALAAALRLQVTAEGVETEAQRRFLAAAGCTEMQGYLFSRPLSEQEIATLLWSFEEAHAIGAA